MLAHLGLVVRTHPLTAFFALALVLSWWTPLVWPGTLNPFGPMLAALIIAPIVAGRAGVADLVRRQTRWHVGLGWYAATLGLLSRARDLGLTLVAVRRVAPGGRGDDAGRRRPTGGRDR